MNRKVNGLEGRVIELMREMREKSGGEEKFEEAGEGNREARRRRK